jgi:ankyrin repeat protein
LVNDFGITPQFSRTLIISEALTEMNQSINEFIEKFDNNTSLDSIHHPIEAISKGNLKYFIVKGIKFNEDVKYKQYYYKLRDSSRNNFLNEANSLHYAAYLGHIHIVSYFIKNCGGNVESKSKDGNTALHFATLSGQLMTMKFLIEECNANIEAANDEGFTPLLIAADNGYLYVIKYLILERKANFKALTKNGYSIIDIILFKKKENLYKYLIEKLKIPSSLGSLSLIQAAKNNDLNFLKTLYEKDKLDPNKADEEGNTPIFFAVLNGNIEMVKYLIEECNIKLNNGARLIHYAIEGKNLDVVKYIIENCNPSLNSKKRKWANIYHSTVISENIEILKYI